MDLEVRQIFWRFQAHPGLGLCYCQQPPRYTKDEVMNSGQTTSLKQISARIDPTSGFVFSHYLSSISSCHLFSFSFLLVGSRLWHAHKRDTVTDPTRTPRTAPIFLPAPNYLAPCFFPSPVATGSSYAGSFEKETLRETFCAADFSASFRANAGLVAGNCWISCSILVWLAARSPAFLTCCAAAAFSAGESASAVDDAAAAAVEACTKDCMRALTCELREISFSSSEPRFPPPPVTGTNNTNNNICTKQGLGRFFQLLCPHWTVVVVGESEGGRHWPMYEKIEELTQRFLSPHR